MSYYLFRGGYIATQSLEGVCHGLVFGHVDESSSQAEMREDEKHLLQDPVHLVQMLERKKSPRNCGLIKGEQNKKIAHCT